MAVTMDDLRSKHRAATQASVADDVRDYRTLVAKAAAGKLTGKDSEALTELLLNMGRDFSVFESDVLVAGIAVDEERFASTYDSVLAQIDKQAAEAAADVKRLQEEKYRAECRVKHATTLRANHFERLRAHREFLKANPRMFSDDMALAYSAASPGMTPEEAERAAMDRR